MESSNGEECEVGGYQCPSNCTCEVGFTSENIPSNSNCTPGLNLYQYFLIIQECGDGLLVAGEPWYTLFACLFIVIVTTVVTIIMELKILGCIALPANVMMVIILTTHHKEVVVLVFTFSMFS